MAAAFGCYASFPAERSNMCWNLINSLPPPPRGGGGGPDEERKRAEAEHQHREAQAAAVAQHQQQQQQVQAQQQRLLAVARERERERERERAYYPQSAQGTNPEVARIKTLIAMKRHQSFIPYPSGSNLRPNKVQRPPSVPSKVEYPPPAHSRVPGVKSSMSDKSQQQQGHTALPKAEPNFNLFGYPAYQPPLSFMQQHHDPNKVKQEQKSISSAVISPSLIVTKTMDREREMVLPNPPPLMSDLKNSVIVKNEGKSPQSVDSGKPLIAHSPSPKMRVNEPHYLPQSSSSSQHKGSPYEYRSPSQSPHHLSHPHTPSPLHQYEGQNLASISKVHNVPAMHHRARQSPHPPPHRQSPHPPPPPQPHHRQSPHSHLHRQSPHQQHPHPSPPGTVVYTKPATVGSYPYPSPVPQMQHYVPQVTTPPKPKVSSPAPPHIYGKPSGITSGTPVCRPQDVTMSPLSLATKPTLTTSPYQQLSQHNPPPPLHTVSTTLPPPPAAHSINRTAAMFDPRMYPPTPPGLAVSVKPPPTSPPSRSSPLHFNPGPHLAVTPAVQKEPLDLGMSSFIKEEPRSNPSSPKRKSSEEPEPLEIKKLKCEIPEPVLSRVSEPSPLLASAATTITTVVNTAITESLEPLSGGGAPGTPVPCPSPAKPGSGVDSEKSNSPGPRPVHKLKKAWLQRHSGEDGTDDKDVVGSGSCVTLPLTLPKKETESVSVVSSLHSIGSMAVNSISKTKTKGNSRKVTKDNNSGSGSGSGNGGLLNGHLPVKLPDADDSSSSDPERKSTPLKRVPPKVKRKKGGVRKTLAEEVKRKKLSASSTDSEKESGSEKESDSGQSQLSKKAAGRGDGDKGSKDNGRKRGRRPKSNSNSTSSSLPKNEGGEESRGKKPKEEPPTPFQKPPIAQLKKTGESFLQDGPCFEVAPKLAKCRECRWTPNQRSRNMPNIFCRFYAFRRLRYTKNGQLAIAGFSDPHRDATQDDLKLWLPMPDNPPVDLDAEMCIFLLAQVGDQFCDLLEQEKEAVSVHMSEEKTIAWKRVVQGVREMCDVCETTLFNYHWACSKCGFVVCIDCYKGRKNGASKMWGEPGRDRDDLSWLLCTNRQPHEQEKLMLTQIIAGDSLQMLGRKVHESRAHLGIVMKCGCPLALTLGTHTKPTNGICKDLLLNLQKKNEAMNGQVKAEKDGKDNGESGDEEESKKTQDMSSLTWLADVALSNEDKKEGSVSSSDSESNYSTLRELLIRPSHKSSGSRTPSPSNNSSSNSSIHSNNVDSKINNSNNGGANGTQTKSDADAYDDSSNIDQPIKKEIKKEETEIDEQPVEVLLKHFVRKHTGWQTERLPIRFMTMSYSKSLYPDVPHAWLNEGKLLHLLDSEHPGNYLIFQEQWKRGQPVIVSDVTKHLDMSLWHPDSFARDFGDTKNDLINCVNGNLIPLQPMRKFWEGFDLFGKRLKDDKGMPMVLKLKDWPPGEDFAEMLPSRYNDLMKVLPLGEYTQRQGRLNLASRLPDCFVRPDLGPKMYTAYGSAIYHNKGTTNLHLDISDAVNVMVYVSIPKDSDNEENCKEAYKAIDESGCDLYTRRRVRDKSVLPGALWHIYSACDADKIRDLLNKVAIERGARLEPHHDPIHDQSWYLDVSLQERLYTEYGVQGYPIVQCLGDAVFIPAGAPHQVRNLNNCIKVAEDFVSPENVSHCFHLTQEFRDLTDTHSNHEDKLQIKNIMYHAVKDSLSVLSCHLKDSKPLSELNNETDIKAEPNDSS